MVNPEMRTNLSRHTVSFSDMAWPESSQTFPKAWQAGQYLKNYIAKYKVIDIQTSSKVLQASRSASISSSSTKRWKIEVEKKHILPPGNAVDSAQNEPGVPFMETHYFDFLIVASGFFRKPKFPPASSSLESFNAPVQHSTEFRGIETLLGGTDGATRSLGSKILVVGGSISGAEVAGSIAMQLSSHVHSPTPSRIKDPGKYTVYHVLKRPFWVLPLFLPVTSMPETNADFPKVR